MFVWRQLGINLERVQEWYEWKCMNASLLSSYTYNASKQVHFVPSLFTDPTQLNTLAFLDGAFNVSNHLYTVYGFKANLVLSGTAGGLLSSMLHRRLLRLIKP